MNHRSHTRITASTLALLALSVSLVACADRSDAPTERGPGPTAAGSGAPAPKQAAFTFSMPLDQYALSPQDKLLLDRAEIKLQEACVRRFGAPALPPRNPERGSAQAEASRRYSLTDARAAARNGYQVADATGPDPASLPQPSALQSMLLSGKGADAKPVKEYQGIPVPSGGCYGESKRKVYGDHYGQRGREIAQSIDFDSYKASLEDPRVKSAFADWSGCMKRHGHTYASPLAVTDDPAFSDPTADERERAVAKADVTCKFEVGLPKTWHAVESAIQQGLIKKESSALDSLAASQKKIVAGARKILSS
ncbi:hypothetical protein [Streptomyces sp. NPDC000410]|uniref:hypothetical protein n=1 Tax=Streptomyces sp. NPDC000410 TaxID=3154254 RepID=UPI0033216DC1